MARAKALVADQAGDQPLDGYFLAQEGVLGLVDVAKAAAAKLVLDAVLAVEQGVAGAEGHGLSPKDPL